MSLDIKSIEIKPKRETFGHVERRIGEGKMASRYEEATYDIQPVENFHYRPYANPKYELYDKEKTEIKMEDWYKFLDPRQYHYSSYVMARAKQQEVAEQNFVFVEKRDMLAVMPEDVKQEILNYVLPLRHYEWGANMNNLQLCSEGYGAALTNAYMFHAEDRLGNAQYLTRIGLLLGENEPSILDSAKDRWLNDESLQPLRKAMEDSFVLEDWFELHIAQNVIFDGFIHPLVFNKYEQELNQRGGTAQTMMTEFITSWNEECERWLDMTIKIAIQESQENKELINQWCAKYIDIAYDATLAIAKNLVSNPEETVNSIKDELVVKLNKNGLNL
ncbi:aromatic/alkene monooxygenase hydroxylase subunit beta [Arcobacter sp. YIC-464]|uniref:aromatic/alkene monooxygenase hydroxylase subunit beta n=1 Tax=Arcobacter sp. YIC-464 TaxID=3376631 RepID=UPI003C1EA30C